MHEAHIKRCEEKVELSKEILSLKKRLAFYEDNCTVVWCVEDVEAVCREGGWNRPTIDEAKNLLNYVERKRDATIGICWETFHYHLQWMETEADEEMNEFFPIKMPDAYYDNLLHDDWGDHPLNNREGVEYNE